MRRKTSYLICQTAKEQRINCQVLTKKHKDNKETFYLLLQKKNKLLWICPGRGLFNSKTGCGLALDKYLTNQILQKAQLPCPQQVIISKPEQLRTLALPSPWAIKPVARSCGRDVLAPIENKGQLYQMSCKLLQKYPFVIIEEFVSGYNVRLLVLKNRFLAAAKRIPARIRGNGEQTIRELIEGANEKHRQAYPSSRACYLKPIEIDTDIELCLQKQNLNLNSVLAKDKMVYVRNNANFSTGGEVEDVTDKVHPQNIIMAKKAVRAIGLTLGGVDVITRNIGRPLTENKGKIIEINSMPSLWLHHYPHRGQSRNVSAKILDYFFENKRLAAVGHRTKLKSRLNFSFPDGYLRRI